MEKRLKERRVDKGGEGGGGDHRSGGGKGTNKGIIKASNKNTFEVKTPLRHASEKRKKMDEVCSLRAGISESV